MGLFLEQKTLFIPKRAFVVRSAGQTHQEAAVCGCICLLFVLMSSPQMHLAPSSAARWRMRHSKSRVRKLASSMKLQHEDHAWETPTHQPQFCRFDKIEFRLLGMLEPSKTCGLKSFREDRLVAGSAVVPRHYTDSAGRGALGCCPDITLS